MAAMKAVILAGGLGTRLSEETDLRPKPMVEIGGQPILWHIMKIYSAHGINDFIICCGYKGYVIKQYFANYFLHRSDVTFDMEHNSMEVHHRFAEKWRVTLIDTGEDSQTGGRLRRVKEYIGDDDFCFTYGDGVGDIDITASVAFHRAQGKLATLTATLPLGRFGIMDLDGHRVKKFEEKPAGEHSWINAGFAVLSPKVIDYVTEDSTIWERAPLQILSEEGQVNAFFHHGFWQPMDTLRDKNHLEELWRSGKAPWKVWK